MRKLAICSLMLLTAPLSAKESLGVFSGWAAFRDPSIPRCYAISEAAPSPLSRYYRPYATIASWPARRIAGPVGDRGRRRADLPTGRTVRVGVPARGSDHRRDGRSIGVPAQRHVAGSTTARSSNAAWKKRQPTKVMRTPLAAVRRVPSVVA